MRHFSVFNSITFVYLVLIIIDKMEAIAVDTKLTIQLMEKVEQDGSYKASDSNESGLGTDHGSSQNSTQSSWVSHENEVLDASVFDPIERAQSSNVKKERPEVEYSSILDLTPPNRSQGKYDLWVKNWIFHKWFLV